MVVAVCEVFLAASANAGTIYNNLTPNNLIGVATRPSGSGVFEIESADDFVLASQTIINMASFAGLMVPGTGGAPTISQVLV